jgi:hypothetical protein
LYDDRQLFADNPIGRYAIGNRDPLRFDSDGSLMLYIQRESPGRGLESNWLPTPMQGAFTSDAAAVLAGAGGARRQVGSATREARQRRASPAAPRPRLPRLTRTVIPSGGRRSLVIRAETEVAEARNPHIR